LQVSALQIPFLHFDVKMKYGATAIGISSCKRMLKKAGVDMTTPQPIYDTLAVFEELVSELERNLE
jgi:hypothetical protein